MTYLGKALGMRPHGYNFWPLIVLGVRAVDGGPDLRAFVRRNLIDLSVSSGTYSLLAAKETLEQFWVRAERNSVPALVNLACLQRSSQ
jgi:hypothetical protein